MQMGRWFGYRRGYEDLFRIWTHKASAEWYAEIADATEKLKEDMVLMRDLGQNRVILVSVYGTTRQTSILRPITKCAMPRMSLM